MKSFKKAFTLIELLVVVAIIGILATVIIVNVTSATVKARKSAVADNLGTAVRAYAACKSFGGTVGTVPVTGLSTGLVAVCSTPPADEVEKGAATSVWPQLPNDSFAYTSASSVSPNIGHNASDGIAEVHYGSSGFTPAATDPYVTCTSAGCRTGNSW